MASVSSLATTAASDESSSADSGRSDFGPQLKPCKLRNRRVSSTLKLRVQDAIAKRARQQKVMCACRVCEGKRMVSRSTCYRHLKIDAEIAHDDATWEARWRFSSHHIVTNPR